MSAILKQNPRFRSRVTSPMLSLINAVQPCVSGGEFASFFDDARRASILRGLFAGYYGDTHGQVVFDTNRLWTGRLALLKTLYPQSRVICCVRDPRWILDSFERALRRNPLRTSAITGYETQPSVGVRLEQMVRTETGILGQAWTAFRDAWHSDLAGDLIVIDYDRLVDDAAVVIGGLYAALGETPFAHDFNALEYDEPQYDEANGAPGLHRVRGKLERFDRPTCLPPELFNKYQTELFWKTRRTDGLPQPAVL